MIQIKNYNLFITILLCILLLLIYNIIVKKNFEKFYNFKNLPNEYCNLIDNINISPEKGIPKIIHHIAPKDKSRWHDTWEPCLQSWLKYFPEPEYKHMMWWDTELEDIIKTDFPWFLNTFRGYDKNIKRIDMVRPFFLYKYGGIYADMDYMVYKNFYNELPQDKVSTPESPYKENEFIQNALLASPPKHYFWLLIIEEAFNTKNQHVFSATGPRLYSSVYYKFPELVNILPINKYNPHIADSAAFESKEIITKHLLSSVWTRQAN
jgi:mannosyltransferase OCH1-like enzyme